MEYKITNYKENIDWIDIKTDSNIEARLCTFGASVYSLKVFNENVILSLKDTEEFLNCPQYFGKTLGRVCGRIKSKGYINNNTYSLPPTLNYDYTLHGGDLNSLSFKNFTYVIKESKNSIKVIFTIVDKDFSNGFPGKARINVIYEFSNIKPILKIRFKGKANKDTLMNLSNHMYFNFNNDYDLSDYYFKMNASQYGVTDENVFIIDTKDVPSYLDFNKMSKIKPRLKDIESSLLKTIDNTFIFNEVNKKKPQVSLKNKHIRLDLYTDYPSMNIYLDNSLTPVKFINRDDFSLRRGIALEPQLYNYDFNSLILNKGEKYDHFITYKFKKLD